MAIEIKKNHDIIFANRPFTRGATALLYNCSDITEKYNCSDIPFAPYGECWRNMRKICVMKLFNTKKVLSFKFVREEEVGIMVDKISHSSLSGTPINLSETLLTLAKDIGGVVAKDGISICSLGKKYGEKGDKRLEELLRELVVLMGAISFSRLFPGFWMDGCCDWLGCKDEEDCTKLGYLIQHIAARHEKLKDVFVDLLLQGIEGQKLAIDLSRDGIKPIILPWCRPRSVVAGDCPTGRDDAQRRAKHRPRGRERHRDGELTNYMHSTIVCKSVITLIKHNKKIRLRLKE
ncbi:hypothetical protein Sjap_013228 [Stephania japonica]|uniref:Cytochrome P450 n=1 Tax=Stephania japonica TaxID=461633 RepID=A0AAP0P141_9MAGN